MNNSDLTVSAASRGAVDYLRVHVQSRVDLRVAHPEAALDETIAESFPASNLPTSDPNPDDPGTFCNASAPLAVTTEGIGWWPHSTPPAHAENRSLVLFDSGDEIVVQGGENGIRFLLVSGQPLEGPVAWYGPVVMNTQAELQQAFDELERGTFLKDDHRESRVTLAHGNKA